MKERNFQKKMLAHMNKKLELANEQILNDSLTNPLLERAGEIPGYYKTWIDGSKLIAVLPALSLDDERAQSYYSVGSIKNEGAENIRISPVFIYLNEEFKELNDNKFEGSKFFLFDTEFDKLYSYEKKKHTQEYHFVKKDSFEVMKNHIVENPVVLFFKGCDDGHVGKRFKTQEEAFEYLQMIDVFEDIFDEDLQCHN